MKTCTVCGAQWSDDTKFCPNDGTTLRAATGGADLIGSVVADRYHIEEKLGEGGMGAVYLGTHVKMGRRSAIKVMAESMANDAEAIARFNREAANAARINHANVCAIYDFGETAEGLIYLAMEFIEGDSLSDVLRREGRVSAPRAAQILRQTADALQAAHDLGIVHRDLKPDNIMLARARDDTDIVKVVDFGIAKAMTGEEGQKVTKTGLVVGTPEYMSPEQLSGDVLDGRSDIYSLALVFYRMLSGELPFAADSAQELMIKRLTDEPIPLNKAHPGADYPPRLQQVMDRALARMPGDRYTSAVAFARDALDAVGGAPSTASAKRIETATQLMDGTASATTARLPKTRVSKSPVATTPPTPAPIPSPVASRKRRPAAAIAAAAAVVVIGGGSAVWLTRGDGPPEQTVGDSGVVGAPVTEDTARQGGGRDANTDPGGGSPEGGAEGPGGQESGTPANATAAVPDFVVLRQALDGFEERVIIDQTTAAAVRDSATTIYNGVAVPDSLRAQAALVLGAWYNNAEQTAEACRWYRNALDRSPSDPKYRGAYEFAKGNLACP